MEYFRLQQDRRIPYSVLIKRMLALPNALEVLKGNIEILPKNNVVTAQSSSYNKFPELLDRQLYLMKEGIKKIIDFHNPHMEYRNFCILDAANDFSEQYYAPILPLVDCLSNMSDCNLDRSVVHKAVLIEQKVGKESIFRIANINDIVVIVNLELAESLLRRKIPGIRLSHVEVTHSDI